MIRVILQRHDTSDQGTFGVVELPGGVTFFSGELPFRMDLPGLSSIPAGRVYRCEMRPSAHFKRDIYHVLDVPGYQDNGGRENVEIHPANFCGNKDKGWHADLLGCVCLGRGVGALKNPEGKMQMAVLDSGSAVSELEKRLGGEPFELEVRKTEA